jgi:hypothetical protein
MTKSKSVKAPAGVINTFDLKEVMAKFTTIEVTGFAEKLDAAFVDRKRFEISKVEGGTENLSIVKKLDKVQKKLALPNLLRAMMALKVDPNFVNHSFSKDGNGPRFNIYAIDKAVDILNAIAGAKVANKVNLAQLKSMISLGDTGMSRTLAQAACSSTMRLESKATAEKLTRHIVSPVTAPTQVSSTMRILQALGLVVNKGTGRDSLYAFNDTQEARAFKDLLAAA